MLLSKLRSQTTASTDTTQASRSSRTRKGALAVLAATAIMTLGITGFVAAPAQAAVAGSTTTGVPAGTALKVHYGDLKITTPGQVVSGLDVRGLVKIAAANVTIKNSIIRGRSVTAPTALINNLSGYSGLKIIDTELFPSKASPYMNGIYGYNFSATRLNIHGVIDGVHITGSNVAVTNSWLHDNTHYTSDPVQGGTPSHDDSIQIQKGDNIKVTGNTISGSYSAGVQITQDTGKVSNFTFTGNLADGGKCTINIAQKTYGPLYGVKIQDNKFGRDTRLANCAIIAPTTTATQNARNYYTPDGTVVAVRKGA